MARFQATRIEQLFREFPGLEAQVEGFLAENFGFPHYNRELVELISTAVGQRLPPSTVSNWVRRRYWERSRQEEKKRIQEQKLAYAAIAELVGERGLDEAAAARLWQAVQAMTPDQLLAMRKQQLQRDQLAHANRDLELKLERGRRERQQVAEVVGDEKADAIDVRRRIREIYGLDSREAGVGPAAGVEGNDSAPALPGSVDHR